MSHIEAEQLEHRLDLGGGLWEHLDISRREIVQLCGEKGIALFIFLLESSTIMPGRDDIALFELQSLHDVAVQLGWSPDTVKRYVAVFRAINLAQHYHDRRQEVKLYLPLGPYVSLTNFTALNELIGKRKKQRQLALKVKTHYVVRFGDPTLCHSDELRTKFQKLNAILDGERLEPLKRQRLQMQIAELFTQLVELTGYPTVGGLNRVLDDLEAAPEGRLPDVASKQGDSNDMQVVPCLAKISKQEDDAAEQGDLLRQSTISSPLKPQPRGDSKRHQGDRVTAHTDTDAALSSTQTEAQGDPILQQGDLLLPSQTQQPLEIGILGDSNQQAVPEQGDPNQQMAVNVEAKAPYTYNVNYLMSNISGNNVIRRHIAQFLADVLEKNKIENGYPTFSKYLKAFKVYTPDVIGRAFLATMVLLHRKNWHVEKPGATFTDQCRILSGQLPLAHYTLDDVEEWLRTWGNLPYPELIVAIAALPSTLPSPEPAPLITIPRQASISSVEGLPGYIGANNTKKKRTYGMHYTGLPCGRKGFNTTGANRPPQSTEKS